MNNNRHFSWTLLVIFSAALVLYCSLLDAGRFGAYHDDGIYVATAKSLAEGNGYRIISLPYEPAQTKYPPFYPFLLSLIWRAYPHFPENLTSMMVLSGIATLTFILITRRYFVGAAYATNRQSVVILAMTALNWRTIVLATSIYSEMVYAALAVTSLYLAEKYEDERRTMIPGLILGTVMGLTFLTRSTGIALTIAVAFYLITRKKYRKAVIATAIVAVFVLGWLSWCAINKTSEQGINVPYYTSYLGHLNQIVQGLQEQTGSSKFGVFFNIGIENLIGGIFIAVPLVCSAFGYNTLGAFHGLLLVVVICVLILILFLIGAGFVRTLSKRLRLIHVYLIVSLGMQLFWLPDISHDRFLMPMLPFLLLFLVSELSFLISLTTRGLSSGKMPKKISGALIGLVVLVVGATLVFGYGSGLRSSYSSLNASAARAAEDAEAIEWVNRNTEKDDVLASYRDPKIFLYTNHKAVRDFPMTEGYTWDEDQGSMDKLARGILNLLDEGFTKYLVVTSTDFELEDRPEQHRKSFDKLVDEHPQNFEQVFKSNKTGTRIYRFKSSSGQKLISPPSL